MPSGGAARWSPSAWGSPTEPVDAKPTPPRTETPTARAADWRGEPGLYAPRANDHYSPGPSLAPIDHRHGASWLGPIVAVVVLALIVGAVAVALAKGRDDGGGKTPTQAAGLAAPALSATAQAGLQTQITPTGAAITPTAPAAKPTQAAEATEKPKPTDTPEPSSNSSGGSDSNLSPSQKYLPTVDQVGGDFTMTEDSTRTRDEVAASFGDPADALAKLKQWGWKENAYRTFEVPAAKQTDPTATTYITVSVHHFSNSDNTQAAFTYFADAVVAAQGMNDVDVATIGNQTRELTSSSSGATNVVLYIRYGNYLIRLGASSPSGDPAPELIALAKKIVPSS
jgi:hypothetical protein